MVKCQFCGKEITSDDKFCPACGRSLSPEKNSKTAKKKSGRDVIIIVSVVVIVVAGYMLLHKEPATQSTGFKHPEVAGMDMNQVPDMEKAMSDLPETFEELVPLGNHYMDNGVLPMAIACYERALAIDSTDPNVMIDLGACYYGLNRGEKAIGLFEKALSINPDQVIGHFNMGIVYRSLGNKEKAVEHWKRVQELQPGTPLADTAKSYIANYDKMKQ